MTMSRYIRGPRRSVDYTPAVAYNAGDVVVVGNVPLMSDLDNPTYSGGPLLQGTLWTGGVYQYAADAAYGNGTFVFWRTDLQQVSAIYLNGKAYPLGNIVSGPTGLASDAGPTGAASLCYVDVTTIADLTARQGAIAYPRNLIDGGDFTTNPFQRGTSQASDITSTLTYGPDRWAFKGAGGSAIDWSQNADTTLVGFSNSLKWQRKLANADVNALNMCQVLETIDCIKMQGRSVTFSFYAKAGANYSGGALTVQVEAGTGTNQSAANLLAATWTTQAHVINTTQAITTAWTRYQFTGTVPATCTQLGVIFQWTPTGTAGADDSVQLNGIQLEDGLGATNFEHRDAEMELALCQRYFAQFNEPANGNIVAAGHNSGTNAQTFVMGLPTPMRVSPTVTVTVGTFKVNSATGGIVAATGLAATGTHTPTQIGLSSTGTGTAGQGATLQGAGGSGLIAVSADF